MENALVACVGSGLQWNQSVTGILCWPSAFGPLAVASATSASSWSTIWQSIWRLMQEHCMPVPTVAVGSESMLVSFATRTCARARAGPLLTGLTSDCWGHTLTSRKEPLLLMDTYPSLPWHPNRGSCNHAKRIDKFWTSYFWVWTSTWQIWKLRFLISLQVFTNHFTGKWFTGHM